MSAGLLGVAIGFISGVLSGAFGIGGGIFTTPGIRLLMGAPALIAVGTPLPVIIPSAITGAISYGRRGFVDLRSGIVLGVSGSATAVAGAALATRAGGEIVLLGTALLIFYAAADTILQVVHQTRGGSAEDGFEVHEGEEATVAGPDAAVFEAAAPATGNAAAPAEPTKRSPVRLVWIGVLTGAYSGFFGLGGGFVLVPMLTRWLRYPIKRAIATSLVAVGILAVPGTITHATLGNVDWAIAAGLAVGVIPGALVGARVTLGVRDRQVRIGFAVMLIATGAWLAVSELARIAR